MKEVETKPLEHLKFTTPIGEEYRLAPQNEVREKIYWNAPTSTASYVVSP